MRVQCHEIAIRVFMSEKLGNVDTQVFLFKHWRRALHCSPNFKNRVCKNGLTYGWIAVIPNDMAYFWTDNKSISANLH